MRHEFFDTFKFAAISFIRILSSNHKRKKNAQDKDKGNKIPKKRIKFIFGYFLGAQNDDPSKDPRAYVLAEVGAVISKKERETQKEK